MKSKNCEICHDIFISYAETVKNLRNDLTQFNMYVAHISDNPRIRNIESSMRCLGFESYFGVKIDIDLNSFFIGRKSC